MTRCRSNDRFCPGRNGRRKGTTTVEFAIIGSILMALVFAGIEFSRANIIRNTVENAAFEGARCGIVPGATAAECINAAQTYLNDVGIQTSTIVTTPSVIQDTTEQITVTVTVPMTAANGYMAPIIFAGKSLSSAITLPRELSH